MLNKIFLFFALFIGVSWAQANEPKIQELEGLSLPPELQGKVDQKDLEKIQNQSVAELKERCEKNGGPDAFAKALNAKQDLTNCVMSLVDIKQLQNEIEEAKPNGNVDEVFKKYCAKKPLFEECARNFTETSKICLAAPERQHLKTVYNVSKELAEFICFKEGDRIALFIAEGGQECFQDQQEGLMGCFNQTGFNEGNLPTTLDAGVFSNITLSFDEKQCKQLADLQNCVVKVLDRCPKPTSANIVESLFKFIRKTTPCKNFPETVTKSGAPAMVVTTASLLMSATALLLI